MRGIGDKKIPRTALVPGKKLGTSKLYRFVTNIPNAPNKAISVMTDRDELRDNNPKWEPMRKYIAALV